MTLPRVLREVAIASGAATSAMRVAKEPALTSGGVLVVDPREVPDNHNPTCGGLPGLDLASAGFVLDANDREAAGAACQTGVGCTEHQGVAKAVIPLRETQ